MTTENTLFFEIDNNESYIRIELHELMFPNAELDWDRNWIKATVKVKAGAFYGQFKADFMTVAFEQFKNGLEILYKNLSGTAEFKTRERQVDINISGNGIGQLFAICKVMDSVGTGNELEFDLNFDQTEIPKILLQLDQITTEFPITGDIKIEYKKH